MSELSPAAASSPSVDQPAAAPSVADPEYMVDHYAVLGVERDATEADIRAAHRAQLSEWHPDKYAHLAPEMQRRASIRAHHLNEAWNTLSDPAAKAAYDAELAAFNGPISTDGTPIITLSGLARQAWLLADPDQRAAQLRDAEQRATALTGYDQATAEFVERQWQDAVAAGQEPSLSLLKARREVARRRDLHLFARELALRPAVGLSKPEGNIRDDGYTDQMFEQLEVKRQELRGGLDGALRQLAGKGLLQLESGDAPTEAQLPALVEQRQRDILNGFEDAAMRLCEIAAAREHVAEHRRKMTVGEYLPAGQPRHERLLFVMRFGDDGPQQATGFELLPPTDEEAREVVPADVAPDDVDVDDPETQRRLVDSGVSVLRYDFQDEMDLHEQIELAVSAHFEPLLGDPAS